MTDNDSGLPQDLWHLLRGEQGMYWLYKKYVVPGFPWLLAAYADVCFFLPKSYLPGTEKTDCDCRYSIGSRIVCWPVQGLFLYKPVSFLSQYTLAEMRQSPCRLWRHAPISVSPNRNVVFPGTEKTSAAVIPYRFPR